MNVKQHDQIRALAHMCEHRLCAFRVSLKLERSELVFVPHHLQPSDCSRMDRVQGDPSNGQGLG